jgi:hypothetical protein
MSRFSCLISNASDANSFVEFWARHYVTNDLPYESNIGMHGSQLNRFNVEELMAWKAGRRHEALARRWGGAMDLDTVNSPRSAADFGDNELRRHFEEIDRQLKSAGLNVTNSIVWVIFLCHVNQPKTVPIYDVNVWLAWGFIEGWLRPEHLELAPTSFDDYLNYRTWFNGLMERAGVQSRSLDQALMTFGQFLSGRWGDLLGSLQT